MSWKKCDVKYAFKVALCVVVAVLIMAEIIMIRRDTPGELSGIKPVFQSDYKDTVVTVNGVGKSVWTSGCGAVAVGMAVGYMTGVDVSCEDLFKWACDNGYYNGNGLGHPALSAMLKPYALKGVWTSNSDLDAVKRALTGGYPVVAHVGPGTFTQNGHYILLIGYKDGRALVNDPGSRARSGKYFDLELIQSELRREDSFMVIKRA